MLEMVSKEALEFLTATGAILVSGLIIAGILYWGLVRVPEFWSDVLLIALGSFFASSGGLVLLVIRRVFFKQEIEMGVVLSREAKTQRPFVGRDEPDPRLVRVEARLFYPWTYSLGKISRLFGKTKDLNHVPRIKLVINWNTKKAYWMGDYAQRLLTPVQTIQWASEQKRFLFSRLDKWCEKQGLTYVPRLATEADLLEGTESIPSRTFEGGMDRLHAQSQLAKDEEEGAETIEREYGAATLVFKVRSTTDWFAVGLVDSRHVKINDWKSSNAPLSPRPTDDPNLSFFRLDHTFVPEVEIAVNATFEVYAGDHVRVFLRKGNAGKLSVDVFDEAGNFLARHDYTGTSDPENYDDFGFAFSV